MTSVGWTELLGLIDRLPRPGHLPYYSVTTLGGHSGLCFANEEVEARGPGHVLGTEA